MVKHLLLCAVLLAGCRLSPLADVPPSDLDLAAGPGWPFPALIRVSNSHALETFVWDVTTFLDVFLGTPTSTEINAIVTGQYGTWVRPQGWQALVQHVVNGAPVNYSCTGGDQRVSWASDVNEFYSQTPEPQAIGHPEFGGMCIGIGSADPAVPWHWIWQPEPGGEYPDFAHSVATTNNIVAAGAFAQDADGTPHPIHMCKRAALRQGVADCGNVSVQLNPRNFVQSANVGPYAFVFGTTTDGHTALARLGEDQSVAWGQWSNFDGYFVPSDAWLTRDRRFVWFAGVLPRGQFINGAWHQAAAVWAFVNGAGASFDDPSVWAPTPVALSIVPVGILGDGTAYTDSSAHVQVAENGNGRLGIAFVATGPNLYPTTVLGGINPYAQPRDHWHLQALQHGEAPYGNRSFDFLGLVPDPNDVLTFWANTWRTLPTTFINGVPLAHAEGRVVGFGERDLNSAP